jgi:transcriptional regulator with XRE-family HTH domain
MTERAPINHAALRAARAAAGVTARGLARAVGCGMASIYDYESGRVRPPALLVPALARALRVSAASLRTPASRRRA